MTHLPHPLVTGRSALVRLATQTRVSSQPGGQIMLKTISIAAALSLATLVAPAHAADVGVRVAQETVSYADLNIQQAAGAKTLLGRIEGAAHRVCGPMPDRYDITSQRAYHSCVSDSMTQAIAEVGSPLLIAAAGNQTLKVATRN